MNATHALKLTDLANLQEAAECLRTLAHPVRLRMVQMMLQGEFTVGNWPTWGPQPRGFGAPANDATLRVLARPQDGRRIYYQVAEPAVTRIIQCIESRFGRGAGRTKRSFFACKCRKITIFRFFANQDV